MDFIFQPWLLPAHGAKDAAVDFEKATRNHDIAGE